MKILVTGANGYLGRGVIKTLLDFGCEVIAACHVHSEEVDKRAIIKCCNIFEIDNPFDYFEKPDILLHMAWRDGFVHYSDAHINDLPKHVSFIEKMACSDVKTIAVMGSMHEVGFYEGSINETTPCHPQNYYGIAKNALRNATEYICKKHGKVFEWLRGFYIVSNDLKGSSIFAKISEAVHDGKKTFPFTLGLNQFDFIDYDEFCLQVKAAVLQKDTVGIINICSGRPERLADRVERFIKENKYDICLEYGKFPDRPYDSKAIWGNDDKIRKIMERQF